MADFGKAMSLANHRQLLYMWPTAHIVAESADIYEYRFVLKLQLPVNFIFQL